MIVTSNIPQAVAAMAELQVVMKAVTEAVLLKTAEKARIILGEELRSKTPVGKASGFGQHLVDTTEGDIAYGVGEAVVTERQTKTIPMKDGSAYPLAALLRSGRRGGYEVRPVNKKALFWPGLAHPVAVSHPGPAAPNPYAAEAAASAMPLVVAVAERITRETVRAGIREALR